MQFCAYYMAILAREYFQKWLVISGDSQLMSLQTKISLRAQLS